VQAFQRGPLASGVPRRGCLRRGGAEVFSLASSPAAPQHTALGLAKVSGFLVSDASNHASELSVRRSGPPTATAYDIRVQWPDLRASQSSCDVQQPQTWHMRVGLDADATAAEIFFEIDAALEDSVLHLGDAAQGFACCGSYRYYAFPGLTETEAAMVRFNLTAGAIKTVYWKYGSCPVEEQDVSGAFCTGWCVLQWMRLYSGNLGNADYLYNGVLRVPYGSGEEPDKRRAGLWYLGLQALDGGAEYTIETASTAPVIHIKEGEYVSTGGCTRLDRYCPSKYETDLDVASSAGRRGGHGAMWVAPASLLSLLLLLQCRRTGREKRLVARTC